jgi:Holliday junction resolvase RusA-like endonuclease
MLIFEFELDPQSWQRAGTGSGHFYTQAKTRECEDEMKLLMRSQMNQDLITAGCSVSLILSIATKDKKLWGKHKTSRPDNDNYEKAVFDAGNGIVWEDDALIWFNTTRKIWGEKGHIRLEVSADKGG